MCNVLGSCRADTKTIDHEKLSCRTGYVTIGSVPAELLDSVCVCGLESDLNGMVYLYINIQPMLARLLAVRFVG